MDHRSLVYSIISTSVAGGTLGARAP